MFDVVDLMSGGVVGVLGSLASNVLGYFKDRQQAQIDLAKLRLEHRQQLEQIEAEAKWRHQDLVVSAEAGVEQAAYTAMAASYAADVPYRGDNAWLLGAEALRQVTRPVLTLVLVAMTGAVYATAGQDLQDVVGRSVVVITATAVSWWFADRTVARRLAGKVL